MIFRKIKSWLGRIRREWTETYEKRLCTFITVNVVLWVWCSYVLAWFGRYEIAQPLSQTAVTTILGVVISYTVKSLSENISKYGYKGKQVPGSEKAGESVQEAADEETDPVIVDTGFGDNEGIGGKEDSET